MDILSAFGLGGQKKELVSFIGGGGKTTTMFSLARALKERGRTVLVTTTTSVFYPDGSQCDTVIMDDAPTVEMFEGLRNAAVICLGSGVTFELRKIRGVAPDFLDDLFEAAVFDCILVEADGAKRKPIKAPAYYEPVVPSRTTITIGIIGLDAFGSPVDEEHVHRAALFSQVTGTETGKPIDEHTVADLIASPEGLFKGVPQDSLRYVLLNKADCEKNKNSARDVVDVLRTRIATTPPIIIASAARGIYRTG